MGRPKKIGPLLPTVWHVPDALWELIEPVLAEYDPPSKRGGYPRSAPRPILDAIIFRLRTGCQWNHLPQELPADSTVHRTFPGWVRLGVLEQIWAVLVQECQELGGVDWRWQAADGALGKARLGGARRAPTRPIAPSAG
jgi:transposase